MSAPREFETEAQRRARFEREELQRAASYFGHSAQAVIDNPKTSERERQFLRRMIGNAWKVADWPTG